MSAFHRRQALLVVLVFAAVLVATASSFFLRPFLVPVLWEPPFYINPFYLLVGALFGGLALVTVFRADDRGWPLFAGLVGLWTFLVAFEDSILQWFLFQLGAATIGGRINPVLIAATSVAMGGAVLLHAGQLGRRLRHSLLERGIDPRELRQVEARTNETAQALVVRLVLLVSAGGVALWIGEFALGRARIGVGALGILGGLLILSVLAVMAFRVLRTQEGVVREPEEEVLDDVVARRPPRGLR